MKRQKQTEYRPCPVCGHNSGEYIITLKGSDLLRCNECKMVFADIEQKTVLEKNIYDEDTFYVYLAKEHFITAAYYDHIIKKIQTYFGKKNLRLLEFGCGSGQFLLRAEKAGIKAFGTDFSPYAKLAADIFNLNIETCDIDRTDYQAESFDVIISHATYEHVYDIDSVSRKLKSLLKPEGLMIISGVPNFSLLSRRWFGNYNVNTPPGHINYFEKHSIKNHFRKHRLRPYKTFSYGLDIWYLKSLPGKIFGNKENTQRPKDRTKAAAEGRANVSKFKSGAQVGFKHRMLAFFYRAYGWFLPGKSLEAWAKK